MILHHIQSSPNQDSALECALRYADMLDTILLSGSCVNALLEQKWKTALLGRKIILLESDVVARGLRQLLNEYPLINHNEFVEQSLTHEKVITW